MPDLESQKKPSFFRQYKNTLLILLLCFLWIASSFSEFYFYERPSIIFIALRNLNIIFALILFLLIGKNIIRIYFERSRKFRTKLVTVLLAWSLIPSIILFFVASGYISEGVRRWFSTDVKKQVENIKYINEESYGLIKNRLVHFAREVSNAIREQSL